MKINKSISISDIGGYLKTNNSEKRKRENEIDRMQNSTKIRVYTDDWIYSDDKVLDQSTCLGKIKELNKIYYSEGDYRLPYHYVVTNKRGSSRDDAAVYYTVNNSLATSISDSDICVLALCRAGSSINKDDMAGMDNLIQNLADLLYHLIDRLTLSPSNIVLDTSARHKRGKVSLNGTEEFEKEFKEALSLMKNMKYPLVADRVDIDFIRIAGPSDSSKRTLGNLSKIICGEVDYDFIKFMKDINPNSIKYSAASTILSIGSYLYVPQSSNFMASVDAESITEEIKETAAVYSDNLAYINEYLEKYKGSVVKVDASDMKYLSDDTKFKLTTTRGGKSDYRYDMELPGYHNAFLQFERIDTNADPIYIQFLISPSDMQETRGNIYQDQKTMGGWTSQRLGPNTISITFSGKMLDVKSQMERHIFLENYKAYMEDTKVADQTYTNAFRQKLVIEGRDYYGHVTSIMFTKSANKQFLYDYTISFMAYNDKKIYDAAWALLSASLIEQNVIPSAQYSAIMAEVADNKVNGIITEETLEDFIKKDTAAYEYLLSQIRAAKGNEDILRELSRSIRMYNTNHWGKKYLDAMIDSNVVTNVENWGNYDGVAVMSDTCALMCKAFGYKKIDGSSGEHWSIPFMRGLHRNGCVTDKTYSYWGDQNLAMSPDDSAMLPKWILEVCTLHLINRGKIKESDLKKYTKIYGEVDISGSDMIYMAYLNVLSCAGYINTPSEWKDFSNTAKTQRCNAMALISKVAGIHVKD